MLLVSFELDEILGLADRILVIYEGRIVLERAPGTTDEHELGLAMTGGAVRVAGMRPRRCGRRLTAIGFPLADGRSSR